MAKQKFKITNWPTYNKALINRGSITFWLDDEAIQAWYESATPSSRGRPQRYSDLAITTVLVIKRVFRLTLRAAQGFIDSIFSLMNVPLRCPDYSCVSRRVGAVLNQKLGDDNGSKHTSHNPIRHYYIFRNRFYYNKKFYSPFKRIFLNVAQTIKHLGHVLWFESDKVTKIKMLTIAYMDYKSGRMGKKTF